MKPDEVAKNFLQSIQKGDFGEVKKYLADDFKFIAPGLPQPLNADAWIGMSMVLKKGFPDLDYHFQVGKVNGNSVMVSSAMTGTQNGELDLTSMGMGKIPPTGKSINVERTNSLGTVQGDKVVEIKGF
jgi:predicted ester cyclase